MANAFGSINDLINNQNPQLKNNRDISHSLDWFLMIIFGTTSGVNLIYRLTADNCQRQTEQFSKW